MRDNSSLTSKIQRDRLNWAEWSGLGAIGAMTFVSSFHVSGVAALLPSIASSIGLAPSRLSWITSSYLISVAALLFLFGRCGDRVGLLRLYKAGLVVFSAASFLCGVTTGLDKFLIFRILQGAGMAMLSATSPALLVGIIRPHFRGLALGVQAAMISAGVIAGPSLSNLLAVHFSWQAVFILAGALTVILIPLTWAAVGNPAPRLVAKPFDLIGGLSWTLGVGSLLGALSLAAAPRDHPGLLATALLFCVLGPTLSVLRERTGRHPFLQYGNIKKSNTLQFAVPELLNYACLYGIGFLAPILLVRGLGLTALACGTLLTLAALPRMVMSPLGGLLSDRCPTWRVPAGGSLIMAVGILAFALACGTGRTALIAAALLLLNCGVGLFGPANLKSALVHASVETRGAAASLLATARSLGMALGVSAVGWAFASVGSREGRPHLIAGVQLSCVPLVLSAVVCCFIQFRRSRYGSLPEAVGSIGTSAEAK